MINPFEAPRDVTPPLRVEPLTARSALGAIAPCAILAVPIVVLILYINARLERPTSMFVFLWGDLYIALCVNFLPVTLTVAAFYLGVRFVWWLRRSHKSGAKRVTDPVEELVRRTPLSSIGKLLRVYGLIFGLFFLILQIRSYLEAAGSMRAAGWIDLEQVTSDLFSQITNWVAVVAMYSAYRWGAAWAQRRRARASIIVALISHALIASFIWSVITGSRSTA